MTDFVCVCEVYDVPNICCNKLYACVAFWGCKNKDTEVAIIVQFLCSVIPRLAFVSLACLIFRIIGVNPGL